MTIHRMFEEQVKSTPHATAIYFCGEETSYLELNQRSNQVANFLKTQKIPANSLIGVNLKRQTDLIAVLIGILKAGHAYLPLDRNYPEERLKFMLEDSKACFVFSEDHVFAGDQTILLSELDKYSTGDLLENVSEDGNLAYVIYTSGSTGKPKGVCLTHSALINLLNFQQTENSGCSTLQFTPVSFDVHFQEIFSTLTTGGTLFLIEENTRADFKALLEFIDSKNIERIFLPFIALDQLAKLAEKNNIYPKKLKFVITAGEQLRITPMLRIFFKQTKALLYNHYGPSETHVVTSKVLTGDPDLWPELPSIGFILPNNQFILDGSSSGEGELIIGGTSVGLGYLGKPDLTEERFFEKDSIRYYRTGDLVEIIDDEIFFKRRKDNQIKIRGHRVELGEVEASVQRQVPNCEVTAKVWTDENQESFLCLYIVGQFNEKTLRESLKEKLPEYMLPRFITDLESFPLTPSGKVDRNNLPEPKLHRPDIMQDYISPETENEKAVCEIWQRYLGFSGIGVNDPFFDLGGTSLMAVNILDDLNQISSQPLSLGDLFSLTTIKKQAVAISEKLKIKPVQKSKNRTKTSRDIAIIAMSGEFPGASSIEELNEMLASGKNGMQDIDPKTVHSKHQELSKDPLYVFKKGEIASATYFDHQFFGLTPREAELMDPQQRKFLEISYQALSASGYFNQRDHLRIGVFAGSANNTYQENLRDYQDKVKQFGEFNVMTLNEKDYLATKVAFKLGLKGPAVSLNTGCSTSLVAIIQAVNAIRLGQTDLALAGGVSIHGQRNLGHLHERDSIKSVDGLCRAFSDDATGTMFTEGLSIVVLKDLEQAEKDGDYIYSIIKGVGINNDGQDKMSFSAPSPEGQKNAIVDAYLDAGVDINQVSFIETHGTGTPIGDPIEVAALEDAFSQLGHKRKNKIQIGSLKSNIGHMTSAAGAGGLIKACLSLDSGKIYPSLNVNKPNPALNLTETRFEITRSLLELDKSKIHYAGVSSFGIGGTNAHVVLEQYRNKVSDLNVEDPFYYLSAKNKESLELMCEDFDKKATTEPILNSLFQRENLKFSAIRSPKKEKWSFFEKLSKPELIFSFPGQGAQYLGMGRELRELDSDFYQLTEYCFDVVKPFLKKDLKEVLYGEDGDIINDTYYTQPAIFIFEYALAKLAIKSGLAPDMMVGHSVGEFVAATLQGVFSLEDALKIICKRSELMSRLPGGSMMSVALDENTLRTRLPDNIDIAALNALNSTVIAGSSVAVNNLKLTLESEGIACKFLHTSHAFHSKMMDPMIHEFKSFIETKTLNQPANPFLSTVTGQIETEIFTSADYWAQHVAKPVRFAPTITNFLSSSKDSHNLVFIEIGPRETLSTLIKRLGHKNSLSLSGREPNLERGNFLLGLAKLKALGLNPKFDSFYCIHGPRNSDLGLMRFRRIEHWLDLKQFEKNNSSTTKTEGTSNMDQSNINQVTDSTVTLKSKIAEIFEEASGVDILEFSEDTCFFEMGMDSLFLTQVALKLKTELKVEISFRQLTDELADLKNLSDFLKDKVEIPQAQVFHSDVNLESEMTGQASKIETPQKADFVEVSASTDAGGLEGIIQAQLNLMQNQLNLLAGKSMPQNKTKAPSEIKNEKLGHKKLVQTQKVLKDSSDDHTLKAELNNSKKAFGAIARIETSKTQAENPNSEFIEELMQDYIRKTKGSKDFTQKSRKAHADPRAVTGFKPESKEIVYPIVVKSSKGQKLIDVDDNEYIDMLCGFGSNFFGNRNDHIQKRIMEQMDTGFEIGPQHPLTAEVSELINRLTGNERSAFCNTGSEAVLGAMRIARTITGRKKIVSFNGSYHGINDEVIIRGSKKGDTFPAAPGINKDAVSNMIVLDYGEDESYNKLESLVASGEIAAVIVEPVQSRRSDFHPKEFLQKVRKLTLEHDICLIFDEVITGFRIALGGAQEYFDVRADLCTYGKIVGGGMPIGVVSGTSKYMDALDGGHWSYGDDSTPTVGVTYFAGTFVRHPLALAAAKGALEILSDIGSEGLKTLNQRSDDWVNEINSFCFQVGAPLRFANFGALMKPKWEGDYKYGDLFFASLRMKGVHCYDGFPWFINLAHTETELEVVKKIIKETVAKFQAENLMAGESVYKNSEIMHQDHPPKEGLSLGRDLAGFPKWYDKNGLEVDL